MNRELCLVKLQVWDATAKPESMVLCEPVASDNDRVFVDAPNGRDPQWVNREHTMTFSGNSFTREKWRDQIAGLLHGNGIPAEDASAMTIGMLECFETNFDLDRTAFTIDGLCLSVARSMARGPQRLYAKPKVPENLAIFEDYETGKFVVGVMTEQLRGVPVYKSLSMDKSKRRLQYERAEDAALAIIHLGKEEKAS
jgi:hypothetical protein